MSELVVDASVALAWHFEDEAERSDLIAERVLAGVLFVPFHWLAEVFNGLVVGERRGRTSAREIDRFIDMLAGLEPVVDEQANNAMASRILPLSRKHALTVYDAIYLELAERLILPLATLDEQLARAARSEEIDVLPA